LRRVDGESGGDQAHYVSVMGQELGETFLELMQDAARLHLK
jgi:hypothetical protein